MFVAESVAQPAPATAKQPAPEQGGIQAEIHGSDKVLRVRRRRLESGIETDALNAFIPVAQQFVRTVLNPIVTSVSACPPFGGLYLKPPSLGRLCEGVTTMRLRVLPSVPRCIQEWRAK